MSIVERLRAALAGNMEAESSDVMVVIGATRLNEAIAHIEQLETLASERAERIIALQGHIEQQATIDRLEAERPSVHYRSGFVAGWHECARWAERDDLHSDVGSPAFERAMDEAYERYPFKAQPPSEQEGVV